MYARLEVCVSCERQIKCVAFEFLLLLISTLCIMSIYELNILFVLSDRLLVKPKKKKKQKTNKYVANARKHSIDHMA